MGTRKYVLMHRFVQCLATCTAFALAACASPPRTMEKEQSSRIATVAVVSAFGEKLYMLESGGLVFQNRRSEHSILEWNIDDEAASTVKRLLEQSGRYTVLPVSVGRHPEVAEAHRTGHFANSDPEVVGRALRALRLGRPVDAFIVLGKHREGSGPWAASGSHSVEGTGLFAGPRSQLAPLPGETEPKDLEGRYGNRPVAAFAFYRISVFRGSDLSLLASRIALMPRHDRRLLEPATSLPFKPIHSSNYKNEFQKFTDEDKRAIKTAIMEVMHASASLTLKELGLAVK